MRYQLLSLMHAVEHQGIDCDPGLDPARQTRRGRQLCHIAQTWRGKPLVSRLAVVELFAATTTKAGLTVRCELDENSYPNAIRPHHNPGYATSYRERE